MLLPEQFGENTEPSEVFAKLFALIQRLRQFLIERFGQPQGHNASHDRKDAHDDDRQRQPARSLHSYSYRVSS